MSQVQKFQYQYASKPLESKESKEKGKILFSNEDAGSNVLKKQFCADRFDDGLSKQSDIHVEDYSSCIYCDVEQEAFWEFLYSDEWNDSVILRVFSGELYNKLDSKLNEMLKDNEISRHVTCAYLKVKSQTNKMKFELTPETVRIEFTYYGKNLEKRPRSTATAFTPSDSIIHTVIDLASDSELSLSADTDSNVSSSDKRSSKRLLRRMGESASNLLTKSESKRLSPRGRKLININLAHFYCLNSLDIKDSIESECDVLEIKVKRKGLGKDSFGSWRTSIDEQSLRGIERIRRRSSKRSRKRSRKLSRKLSRKGKDGEWEEEEGEEGEGEEEEEEEDDDDDDDDDDDSDDDEDEEGTRKRRKKKKRGKKKSLEREKKEIEEQGFSSLIESQEPLMSVLSADIQLRTMVFDQNAMNQVQCFLYAQISRVLESKEKKRTIVFSNEVTGSTFLNRSVYINRFDGSFQPSDIQTENYSSCSFCDVEQADFWDFLYSDLWNDKFILRVLSGELYTALDVSLHELLQADEISRFVTFAYLKVKSEEEKEELKFDLSPEIVQVEFTYYNRNKSEKHSFSETVSHLVTEIQSLSNLTLDSELLSDVSLTKPSEDNTDMETESKSKINQVSSAGNLSPIEKNVININLGHFPCPNSLDIENDAESDCDSLENEIQKGKWITKDESLEKERPWHFGSKHQMMVRSMLQNSKWDTKGRTSRKLLTKTSKQNLEVTEVDVKEKLLMPAITMDINLSVLGRIMERERFLKFKKMSPKDRKKFFLSDERLEKVNQKLKTETLGETDLEHSQPTSRKTSRKHEKIMDIKNMEKFATLALGIVESPAIYRALIWLGKCQDGGKSKNLGPKSKSDVVRSRHALFGEEEYAAASVECKRELFKERNKRSFVRTFTYHPKFFTPPKVTPLFETNRLHRSYSTEYYEKRYDWEKQAGCKFLLTKTKIIIPDFTSRKLEISSEMVLKALGDFIVRKERIISSKGASLTSIAFIRPGYLNKLFF